MTNAEIFTQFENFIDDAPDRTLEVQLANMAKGKLEAELKLEITKKLNTSLTSTVGGTYTTQYSLPADILEPMDTIYVGTTPRTAIPMAQREMYKNDQSKFYIDLANNKFYLCGTVQTAETITIPYIYKTTDIADDSNSVVVWPSQFHMLIPMQMALMWPAIEGGDKTRSWDDRWTEFYKELKNNLIDWDAQWKLSAINRQTPYGDMGGYPPSPYQLNLPA